MEPKTIVSISVKALSPAWVHSILVNGDTLICGCSDHTIQLWDLKSKHNIMTLIGHSAEVSALTLTENKEELISGSIDTTIRVWDLKTGQLVRTLSDLDQHSRIEALVVIGETLFSASSFHTVKVWDLRTGMFVSEFIGHKGCIYTLIKTPNEKQLVSGSRDGTVRIWDIESGATINTYVCRPEIEIHTLAITSDGERVAIGYDNIPQGIFGVKVWNLLTDQIEHTFTISGGRIRVLRFTADDQSIICCSASGNVEVRDIKTMYAHQTLTIPRLGCGYWTTDNQLVYGEDCTVRILNVERALDQQVLGGISFVHAMALASDNRIVCGHGGKGDKISIINDAGIILKQFAAELAGAIYPFCQSNHALVIAPCGIIYGSSDKIIIVDEQGQLVQNLSGHKMNVFALAVSPDGKTLASGSWDGEIRIWNLTTMELTRTITGHAEPVLDIKFSVQGKLFVSASADKTAKIWNIETGCLQMTLEGHTDWVMSLAIVPDGRIITGSADKSIKILKHKGDLIQTWSNDMIDRGSHVGWVVALAVSPDGKFLASGYNYDTVMLWDIVNYRRLDILPHSDSESLLYTADGKLVMANSGVLMLETLVNFMAKM